jgi:CRP-like cAMP-binding protein
MAKLPSMSAISANELFSRLPAPVQAALLPHLKLLEVARGQLLIDDREPVTQLGFPLTCVARIDAPMGDGRYAHTGELGRHHMVGTHVVHTQSFSPRRVTVLIPGYIATCDIGFYRNQFKRSTALRDTILWLQMQAHRRVGQLAACNATHDLRQRLSRLLLQIHYMQDITVLPVAHADLAHILSVRREAITRELAEVEAAGLVSLARNRIELVSLEGLVSRSCPCHTELMFSGCYDYSTLNTRRRA